MNKTQKSILFILLAAGIFARAYRLGDKPLWIDEGINLKVAAFKSVAEIRAFYVNEQHTALPNIIDHYWIRTAGKSMAALHSESLMWSVAALLLFAALAAGNLTPSAALGATAVFSIGAFQPEYAQMLRYPALSQFAACVWMLGFFRYVRHGGAAALTLFAAGAVLSVFAHIYGLFILAASAVFVLAARKKLGGRFLPLLAAHLVPAAAIAPKIVMYKTSGLTSLLHTAPPLAIIKEIALHPVSGQAHVMFNFCMGAVYDLTNFPKLATIAVFAVFGVAAVAAATRGDNRFAACWCAWVIAAATTAGWIVSNLTSTYYASKFYVPLFAAFSLLMGIGAENILKKRRALAPVLLCSFIAFSFFFNILYWMRLDRPQNPKTIVEYAADNSRPGDFIVISPPYPFFFDYYWKGYIPVHDFSDDFSIATTPQNTIFLRTAEQRQITASRMDLWHEKLASRFKRVWVLFLFGPVNTEDHSGEARKWLDSHYTKIETLPYMMFPHTGQKVGELILYEINPSLKNR